SEGDASLSISYAPSGRSKVALSDRRAARPGPPRPLRRRTAPRPGANAGRPARRERTAPRPGVNARRPAPARTQGAPPGVNARRPAATPGPGRIGESSFYGTM